jgi:penicillin amidase
MKQIQGDLVSPQARRVLALLRPYFPDTPAAALLAAWDLRYDTSSLGAALFEEVYERLLAAVYGERVFGIETWTAMRGSTSLLSIYFPNFDQGLADPAAPWFSSRPREETFRAVLAQTLARRVETLRPWGELRQVTMHNLFFGGRLPGWLARLLGIDYGPIAVAGGRGTPVQGSISRSHGRKTSFAPSYRFVTDMSRDDVQTVLAGGPSDRIWSGWYTTDIKRWLGFGYKTLSLANAPDGS